MILNETQQLAQALAPAADRFAGTQSGAAVNLAQFGHVTFVIQHGTGATGTYTVTVEADSVVGFSGAPEAIPFKYRVRTAAGAWGALTEAPAAGFTTTAGSDRIIAVEVDAATLPDTKGFCRLKTVEVVDDPVAGAVVAVLSKAAYPGALMPLGLS